MHVKEIKPIVGRVYKLDYNGVSRVALVVDYDGRLVYVYDFVREGPRNYKESKIVDAEDITDKVLVLAEDEWTETAKAKLSRVYKVFVDEHDSLYAVNI
jgi:hypothetical protein